MFRAMTSPIFRSAPGCGVPPHPGYQPPTLWVHYTTSCKHSLVLLKMGEIIARNMLSRLDLLINRYCCIYLLVYIICSNFKPAVKCVPGSIPLRPTLLCRHMFQIRCSYCCNGDTYLPGTSKPLFCQTTCFTPKPNMTGNFIFIVPCIIIFY